MAVWLLKVNPIETLLIGHIRVAPKLCFKARLGEKSLMWKWLFILMQIKLIFTRKVSHLASFLKCEFFVTRKGQIFYRLALFNSGHIVMCNKRCALQNQWITLTRLTDTNCFVINIKGCIFASLRLNKRRRSGPGIKSSSFWS